MTSSYWSDDKVEQLKKLWDQGLSASQIAAELGDTTRNSVIGKVHRLGLSSRTRSPRYSGIMKQRERKPADHAQRATRIRRQSRVALAAALAEEEVEAASAALDGIVVPMQQRLSLLELTDDKCKFPIGDPQHDGFHFCGARSPDGIPYCIPHARIAYQPPQQRVQKKR